MQEILKYCPFPSIFSSTRPLTLKIDRNRTAEAFYHEIPELRDWTAREEEGILRAKPSELEERAARRYHTLHIPDATVLCLKNGNRVNGISRRYLHCRGFVVSNAFPNNVVQMKTGEIVYVENFTNEERDGVVVLMGREFKTVSALLGALCNLLFIIRNSSFAIRSLIERRIVKTFGCGWDLAMAGIRVSCAIDHGEAATNICLTNEAL